MTNTTGACNAPPPFGFGGQPGVYCNSTTGVDLMQAFLAADYARRIGAFSFGISPIFALQRF
jgi:hypothetical protein